jgi:hypothetical protein
MSGQLEACVGMPHLNEYLDFGLRRQRSKKHGDGRKCRLVACKQERANCRINFVSAPCAGDGNTIPCLGRIYPRGKNPVSVSDNLDIEFERTGPEPERGECADSRPAAVRKQELIPGPCRQNDLGWISGKQDSHAGGR